MNQPVESKKDWDRIWKHIDELIVAEVNERLPIILQDSIARVLEKQRKDIADELVRILLEKVVKS